MKLKRLKFFAVRVQDQRNSGAYSLLFAFRPPQNYSKTVFGKVAK